MAFALQKSAVAHKAAVCQSRASVRVCAVTGESSSHVQKASALAAFAAAALLTAHPASAGVILEQPKLKKALVDDSPAAPAPKREIILPGMRSKQAPKVAGTKQAAAKKAPEPSVQGGDLDPRAIALPGSLALIAGGAYALTKVDEGFADFMTAASCKDSGEIGAGYETAIKGDGALAIKPKSRPSSKAGTKKAATGTGFSLGGLLNKE